MSSCRYFFVLFIYVVLLPVGLGAQEKVWIFLTDKKGVDFDPHAYFDQKAIERRLKHGLELDEISDFPVKEEYLVSLGTYVDSVSFISRWFNAVVAYVPAKNIPVIRNLEFVREIRQEQNRLLLASAGFPLLPEREDLLKAQTESLGGSLFKKNGLNGKGVRIAVFDVGFINVDQSAVFRHLYEDKRVKGTYDFVANREDVYRGGIHGTMVLSCIAGKYRGQDMGLASHSEFLLARTERDKREPFSEEENWLAAAEWADKNGADIISSSLGYTNKRYFPSQMDGKSSLVSRAANMAASKGMLVVNSAGNEGSDPWKIIGAPADADSVLAIGGIDPWTGFHQDFSSYGPTPDGRLKPNVSAFAYAIAEGRAGLEMVPGTSFSCPLVAGFAACVMQLHPEWTNMEVFKKIQESGSLNPYFDYAHGYGMPKASFFVGDSLSTDGVRFEFEKKGSELYLKIRPEDLPRKMVPSLDPDDRIFIKDYFGYGSVVGSFQSHSDHLLSEGSVYTNPQMANYFFLKTDDEREGLLNYFVVAINQEEQLLIRNTESMKGKTVWVHYRGVSKSIKL